MTIKKNGGVFGRNPKFRNVAVDTLTVGGAVATFPATSFTAARTDAAQSFTGDQTLATGNLVIGTAGKGIDFSADASAAGMTSELLDDYEEGTWTPGMSFGGGTTGITYSVRAGYYTKIGNIVNVTGQVELSNVGSSTGSALITGLPFLTTNNQNGLAASGVRFANISYTGMLTLMTSQNNTNMLIEYTNESGDRYPITNSNCNGFSYVIFSMTYRAA